jgi:hypothetical protein
MIREGQRVGRKKWGGGDLSVPSSPIVGSSGTRNP